MSLTTNEVYQAIIQLTDRKASGLDQITDHQKFASPRIADGSSCHRLLSVIKDKAIAKREVWITIDQLQVRAREKMAPLLIIYKK